MSSSDVTQLSRQNSAKYSRAVFSGGRLNFSRG